MRRARGLVAVGLVALGGCSTLFPDEHAPELPPLPLERADVGPIASFVRSPEEPERFSIDLATSLRLAGARDPDVRLAEAAEERARNQVARALFSLFPTFAPFFRPFNHDGRAQAQTGRTVDVTRTNYELQVLGVAFVDPGPVAFATLAARRREGAAAARTDAERADAIARAGEGYLELVGARARAAVAERALAAADELARREEGRERLGAGTRARVLAARAERAERKADLVRARGDVARASARLASQLQLGPGVELVPRDAFPPLLELTDDLHEEELTARAWAERPELRAANEEVAARTRLTEGREYAPLVPFLSAGNAPILMQIAPLAVIPRAPKADDDLVEQREDSTYYYPTRAYVKGWAGGLLYGPLLPFPGLWMQTGLFGPTLGTLRYSHDIAGVVGWNVGPGGIGDVPRIRGARLAERRARLEEQAVRSRIQREVAVAATTVRTARARVAAAREEVAAAEEAARLSRDRLDEGVAIELEVLEAERGLVRARAREVDARVAADEAQLRLLRAIGGLR